MVLTNIFLGVVLISICVLLIKIQGTKTTSWIVAIRDIVIALTLGLLFLFILFFLLLVNFGMDKVS